MPGRTYTVSLAAAPVQTTSTRYRPLVRTDTRRRPGPRYKHSTLHGRVVNIFVAVDFTTGVQPGSVERFYMRKQTSVSVYRTKIETTKRSVYFGTTIGKIKYE